MHYCIALISLIFATNSALILCYIAIKTVINLLHGRNETISIPSSIRYPTILAISLYCGASVSSLYFMYQIFISPDDWFQPTGLISFSAWLFAGSLLAFIFIRRLKYSFKDTKYSYSKCVLTTLKIMVLLYPILWIIIMTLRILSNVIFHRSNIKIDIISGWLYAFWIAYHAIYTSIVLVLFQNKLIQLIKSYFEFEQKAANEITQKRPADQKIQTDTNGKMDSVSTATVTNVPVLQKLPQEPNKSRNLCKVMSDSVQIIAIESASECNEIGRTNSLKKVEQFGNKKLELINNMTRYTLLVSICGFTSLLVIVEIFATHGMYQTDATHERSWLRMLFYYQLGINVDSFINGLCLFLFFPFASKTYGRLCKYPHRVFANCCEKCIDLI